ncbi:retropepsin-like aspartic protease [Piscinibacter sp. XHJ-5]|uniref:retropepsin-like aspartic protease family protein n=1 Tax=Piscinibacter sp. XHJ-5 TaxID=3037797 RepID=UPI002453120C|nr:retropepsin-like aspartic protease [Piscinibacter sp. XHJ-5]
MDHPHTLKVVTGWLLVGLAVFVGIQWWLREQQQTRFQAEGGRVEIRRAADGHYHWPGTINGRPVDFLIDTGASGTAIPAALARELRLPLEQEVESSTAGGIARGHATRADIVLDGGVRAERLRIVALPALDAPLLGMNVLGRLHWRQRDGVLTIDLGPGA